MRSTTVATPPCHVCAQLQAVQCGFVLRMLESTSFTKLLCGVRECNVMLSAAAQLDSLQHRVLGHAGLDVRVSERCCT
jgi:hypothetical protein